MLYGQYKQSKDLELLRAVRCSADLLVAFRGLLAKAPCGPKSIGATGGVAQLLGLFHNSNNDTLKNQLGNAIAVLDLHTTGVPSGNIL